MQIMRHTDPFLRLRTSEFRRSFFLDETEKNLVYERGIEYFRDAAYRAVRERLSSPSSPNEGHQTPYRGHPIFKAMHATATCCRRCLFQWHRIPRHRALEGHEIDFIVDMITRWIETHA